MFPAYRAYRHGVMIGEGPTPAPPEIIAQATEIQWVSQVDIDDHAAQPE